MNLDPNSVIFDSVDSISIIFLKLSKSIISHLISSFDLIEFQRKHKNGLILHGFDPCSSLYHLIHDYFSKLVSLLIVFLSICVNSMTAQIRFIILLLFIKFDVLNYRLLNFLSKKTNVESIGLGL